MAVPVYQDMHFLDGSVRHGFFGRRGGVSTGIYGSLNCGAGTDDDPDNIRENRERVASVTGTKLENLVTARQIHSDRCVIVTGPWGSGPRPEADAMVTDVPNVALAILTADCGPVLFSGRKADGRFVIGAAHAGWGGAVKGILDNTVRMMAAKGAIPESIQASLGPCIGPASYEVSKNFTEPFFAHSREAEHFFKAGRKSGHLMFDLPGYIAWRLAGCGVRQVRISGFDTYALENEYFSYRRATHREEPDYGRQISTIMIQS